MQNDAIAAVQAATDTVTGRSPFIPIPHTQMHCWILLYYFLGR